MADEFALEPSPPDGTIPERVIDELRHARRIAKDYAQSFSDAVKAQAELRKIKPSALKRYIAALEDDTLDAAAIRKLLVAAGIIIPAAQAA